MLQAWVKILTLAFLVVGGSCGLLIPIMLYVLDLRSEGWTWQYCALFGSMVASTDAVAIVSTMKASTSHSVLYTVLGISRHRCPNARYTEHVQKLVKGLVQRGSCLPPTDAPLLCLSVFKRFAGNSPKAGCGIVPTLAVERAGKGRAGTAQLPRA